MSKNATRLLDKYPDLLHTHAIGETWLHLAAKNNDGGVEMVKSTNENAIENGATKTGRSAV